MTRGLALFVGLGVLVGCGSTSEDDTSTSSPTTTPSTMTAATMTATSADTGGESDETHGLTFNEEGTTEGNCEMFDFTEVDGCDEPVGEQFCSEGSAHQPIDTELEWDNNPPHSGPHWPMWSTWGEHEATLEREFWVHNLEHGGIVLSYRCGGDCDSDVEVFRTVAAMRPELRILITPDPELPADGFAAISWTWVHLFDTPDLDTLLCFVDQHENHAPEDVP